MTRNTYTTRSELYSPNWSLFIPVINILFLREVTCLINATLNRYNVKWLGISFLLSRTITVNKVISCDLFLITCVPSFGCSLKWLVLSLWDLAAVQLIWRTYSDYSANQSMRKQPPPEHISGAPFFVITKLYDVIPKGTCNLFWSKWRRVLALYFILSVFICFDMSI